jgi:dTDP-glucose pyrophosphorylase
MKFDYRKHLIRTQTLAKECLKIFNELGVDVILFVVTNEGKLLGSLTDGDIRRGLLNNLYLESIVDDFMENFPRCLQRGKYNLSEVISLRERNIKIVPVIDENGIIISVINLRNLKSYLPVDAIIMAGGRGERLKPITDKIPKPLLVVGDKPIIKHNLDRLILFGVDDFWISIRYMGEKIKSFVGDGKDHGVRINYILEEEALGTIGSISLVENFQHEYILVMNSDILTNLDYEKFFLDFIESDADFSVATIPYNVDIPYAILETTENLVTSFKEKPTITYFANAGIYLMKKSVCKYIPKNQFYNATDLIQCLLDKKYKVNSFPLRGYWLDIGKHDDFAKAQKDLEFINF